jgi:UDP-3-O-[3-hydroxymyristoyl] glucosamine N-acyltransferase
MKFTAQQIATLVQGEIEGDSNTTVQAIAKIEDSKEGSLCFLANTKYEDYLYTTQASIVLINKDYILKKPVKPTLIRVKDAYSAFATLLQTYQEIISSKPKVGIESPSFVASDAVLQEGVYIGAFSYISEKVVIGHQSKIYPDSFIGEHVSIGSHTIIHPGVKIYKDCVIGDHVIIHSGAVIGSDGFGFAYENGKFNKIPQLGNVVIENDVEIGANCSIDRATIGSTLIKKGAKLDNLIQIAHNVEIGENTVIAAQAGISGSSKIGNHVMIGGQAGIVGHIKIAAGTKINAQSGVSKEIKENGTSITGSPAFEYKSALKSQAVFKNLPSLLQRVNQLEQALNELQNKK